MAIVGIVHPGEMGAGIAGALVRSGHEVLWSGSERSDATKTRAQANGLLDVTSVEELGRRCQFILSICPPHAALDVARQFEGFSGRYVDANAISPHRALQVRALIEASGGRYVDGGIIGAPPRAGQVPRFYMSGEDAPEVVSLFNTSEVSAKSISDRPAAASALKMSYAAWTKGSSALLLAARALAIAEEVEEDLLAEWSIISVADLHNRSQVAASSAITKGWRWAGEMDEIAESFLAAGLPEGFHRAAAEIYRRSVRTDDPLSDQAALEKVMADLIGDGP